MTIKTDSQRGVALLTILLLVVSITVVAGAMLASQKIAIRRSGLLFDQNQLLQDIASGQQLAVAMIRAESKLNDTDSAQDIWAKPIPPYALGNHSITIALRDEASRFNINNLYHDGQADPAAIAVFQRLLIQLNLEPNIAIAALDWQDNDNEVYKDGGDESAVYAQQMSSATTLPNQPFISVDQLQELRGVSAEVLTTLKPFVTTVPYYLPINVNTATPELLAALVDGVSVAQMQALIKSREQQAIKSIEDIVQQPPLDALNEEQRQSLESLLSVESQAFTALITATDSANNGQARQRFATILISKTGIDDSKVQNNNGEEANSGNSNSTNTGDENPNNDTKNPKTVNVVSQRLWAFRPNF